MAESSRPPLAAYLHPRFWPTWLGLGLMWLTAHLPFPTAMAIGRLVGRVAYRLVPRRRFIADVNLRLAFPERGDAERETLLRSHFESVGMGLVETALSWWGSEKRLQARAEIEGMAHLEAALAAGKGAILLSAHFTSLEMGGRILAAHLPLHVIYRPHENPLFERIMSGNRERRYGKAIPRNDMREMIRSLKAGFPVWYASDQNFGHKHGVFAPFFGVSAATNTSVARIARISGAPVVPFFSTRSANHRGFRLQFLPPLDEFPSDNPVQDATRINALIETQARVVPEQYLWMHRRYKDHPDGGPDRYSRHTDRRY